MTVRCGFIGLGAMGSPMAMHLLKGGHALAVWARRPGAMRAHVAAGARACTSPADVAARSDVVFSRHSRE